MNTLPEISKGPGPVVIVNDTGGNPYEYAQLYESLKQSGREVRLGWCNSACTMLMSLPKACLLPGMQFGFHASNLGGRFNKYVTPYYTPNVRARFEQEWGRTRTMTKLTAEQLVALDPALKLCKR